MSIEIRILKPGDEALLVNIAPDIFDDPTVLPAAQEFLNDPRHHIAVAIDNGVVIGFASGVHYVHPDEPHPEFWINEVGVAPTHHARGIGKSIMRALLEVARNLGCAEAWVLTERTNLPAMKLYTALGGVEASEDAVMFTFALEEEAA